MYQAEVGYSSIGERMERIDFVNSVLRAPAGIKFGKIANEDVDKVRK